MTIKTENSGCEKGFTLIELLIVIAIIAVLAVVVILALNPLELLRQARDSNRVSDLATLKTALAMYLADGQTTSGWPTAPTCYTDTPGAACNGTRFSSAYTNTSSSANRNVDGTGWIPINLTLISSGSPIAQLPKDPVSNTAFFYAFAASSTSGFFEINADMESNRYRQGGTSDVESTDGGNSPSLYEVGSKLDM
jgi:prepilin-type N-terminal cleavage/methylation domain-containing protein